MRDLAEMSREVSEYERVACGARKRRQHLGETSRYVARDMSRQVLAIRPKAAATNLQLNHLRQQVHVAHSSLERCRVELTEIGMKMVACEQTTDAIEKQVDPHH